ncbi:FecR family protein [Sphingobacterium cellulitidis]|uniref:FecR family protein n=1 Tax=Sphingobacterium cellulitidis TaxID=1768011 RepID=UPI00296F94DA
MDTDKDYVEGCISEVWDQLGLQARLNTDDNDLEKFKQELDQRKNKIVQLPPPNHREGKNIFSLNTSSWIKAVAAMLFFIGSATLIIYNTQLKTIDTAQPAGQQNDILPGSDKALLTLSDGFTVSLSAAENGRIALQEGLEIEKTKEGEIVYTLKDNSSKKSSAFNSVVTPNGGQYRVTLPDGSKALLNAASSLTYPVHFSDKERRVKMTGEVYFEIAKATNSKNKRIPFFVETARQEIQVLGTNFNVNAYNDENYQSTILVEGSVGLKSTTDQAYTMLKPGQKATLGSTISVTEANIKQDLAWINGNFIFQREELQSILRKISRWYDLDIECPQELGKMKFTGKVSRNQPLSAVIAMISATDKIQVQLKERRLIVKK